MTGMYIFIFHQQIGLYFTSEVELICFAFYLEEGFRTSVEAEHTLAYRVNIVIILPAVSCMCVASLTQNSREREREREIVFVGWLTPQQHASVSQGWRERERERSKP